MYRSIQWGGIGKFVMVFKSWGQPGKKFMNRLKRNGELQKFDCLTLRFNYKQLTLF